MKRLLLVLGAVILVVGGLAVPALAQDSGVVTVTFDLCDVAVTVSPSAVDYWVVPIGATGLKPLGDPWIAATNNGTCWADMSIKGANTDNWTLVAIAGPDEYVHYFGDGLSEADNVTYSPLSLDYQDLGPFVSYSPDSDQSFKLMMDTAASSNLTGVPQTTSVTVMVTMVEAGIRVILWGMFYEADDTAPIVLTPSVIEPGGAPVNGIPAENFRTFLDLGYGAGFGPIAVNFTETDPVFGIYSGTLPYSPSFLGAGTYWVEITVWDSLMREAKGTAPIDVIEP